MTRPTPIHPTTHHAGKVTPFYVPPEFSLTELRWRYNALGELRDSPLRRSFISRCQSFDDFLRHGPVLAAMHRSGRGDEQVLQHAPGLVELALEAWPAAWVP
jgi:hypothetical protein